jgi:cytochrome c oxidase cbb3-type subunit 1
MQVEGINRRLVKFIWAAAVFFAWTLIQGAVQAQEPVRLFMEAGPGGMIGSAHTHVGLMGWMSVALMVAIYYVVPILSGKPIVWPKLIEWIFLIFVVCTAVGGILMIIGGILAGSAFAAGVKGAQLASIITPYGMSASLLCTISVIAGLMFVVQILVSLTKASKASS